MATVYSGQRYNQDGTCWWRIRVDYTTTTATAYVDVGPSGWSIWLRFTTGTNTFTKSANVYYASNNGSDSNKLGSISIDKYTTNTITQTCSGSDWGGTVNGESSAVVPRQATPPAPTCSASVSNIGTDRATYTAQMTNNPYSYWRIHAYDSNGTWKTYSTTVNTPCSFTQTGLAHNTSYSFSYRYSNSSDGEISNPVYSSFTTSGNAPVINSITPSPSRTSCSLANNSISYDTNASLSTVAVRYGTTSSYGSTSSSSNLTGLTPNTTYYYSMTVTDNFSRTSAAKTGSFTTTGNAPTVSSVTTTPSRTECSFTLNVSYDTNASFSSRSIEYGTSTSYGSSTTGTSISGLTPNTTYYYRAKVTDNYSRTSDWKTGSFITSGNPPTISNVSGTVGETTYSFTYTATYDTNAAYSSIETQWGTTTSYGSSGTSTSITGLTPDTHYYYRFRVTDTKSHTSDWYTSEFTTLASTTLKIKVNGVWKDATPYVNVNGTWKKAKAYMNVNGTWKQGKS